MADLDTRIKDFTKDCSNDDSNDDIKKLIKELGFDSSNPGGSEAFFNQELEKKLGREINTVFNADKILNLTK